MGAHVGETAVSLDVSKLIDAKFCSFNHSMGGDVAFECGYTS